LPEEALELGIIDEVVEVAPRRSGDIGD